MGQVTMDHQQPVAVSMAGVTKRFPGVLANDNVSLEVRAGEIHGLLGENGAGKTTLMNILYGLERPDSGEITVLGRRARLRSPKDAFELGIGMVHQHFMLVKPFSVAANIVLGLRGKTGWRLNESKAEALVRKFTESLPHFQVDPRAQVEDLSVGMQQRVEILKSLFRQVKILILDEPTAVLTPQEADELFGMLRTLREGGLSVIFISHKLSEVMELTDRVTVMRGGRVVGTRNTGETSQAELARMMVGRDVAFEFRKEPVTPGEIVLSVEDLHVEADSRARTVNGVHLNVREGEILGIAGVDGNGQRELVEAIVGLRAPKHGRVTIGGQDLAGRGAGAFVARGGAYIPEDRRDVGLVLEFSVAENLVLKSVTKTPNSFAGILNQKAIRQQAEELVARFDVRTPSIDARAGTLSGGNQQKVVVAREIGLGPRFLVAVNPTRGLDVGASEYVRSRLLEQRDNGRAVLLVSTELDEIIGLSDRIAVIYGGRIVGEVAPDVPRETIGLLMAGITDRTAGPGAAGAPEASAGGTAQ